MQKQCQCQLMEPFWDALVSVRHTKENMRLALTEQHRVLTCSCTS